MSSQRVDWTDKVTRTCAWKGCGRQFVTARRSREKYCGETCRQEAARAVCQGSREIENRARLETIFAAHRETHRPGGIDWSDPQNCPFGRETDDILDVAS